MTAAMVVFYVRELSQAGIPDTAVPYGAIKFGVCTDTLRLSAFGGRNSGQWSSAFPDPIENTACAIDC